MGHGLDRPWIASAASNEASTIDAACVPITVAARIEAVDDHPGEQAEDGERQELTERERADRHRRVSQLEDEPCHGDVLHPGSGHRDDLPGEEEPVVAVLEAREGAPVEAGERRRHRSSPAIAASGSIASATAASCAGSRVFEPGGEPGRPARPNEPQHPLGLRGQLEADTPAIATSPRRAAHETGSLETADVP